MVRKSLRSYFPKSFAPLDKADELARLNPTKEESRYAARLVSALIDIPAQIRSLFFKAYTHSFTNLPNRRLLQSATLETTEKIAAGQSQGAALILMDMDQLHAINTRFGLAEGDRLLTFFAQKLDHLVLRNDPDQNDMSCHFGGDEFAVLITNSSPEKIASIHQTLCDELQDIPYKVGNQTIYIGASMGLTHIAPNQSFSSIMEQADNNLKKNKEHRKPQRDQLRTQLTQAISNAPKPPSM